MIKYLFIFLVLGGFLKSQDISVSNYDKVNVCTGNLSNGSPADAQTQYFHSLITPGAVGTRTIASICNGVITDVSINICPTSVLGTSEAITIGIYSGSTSYTVTTTITADANPKNVIVSNLNIPITKNSALAFYWITPTWATNPTGVYISLIAQAIRN